MITASVLLLGACGHGAAPDEPVRVDVLATLGARTVRSGVADLGAEERVRLGAGWNAAEPSGRWTSSTEAHLTINLLHDGPGHVEVDAAVFDRPDDERRLVLMINGVVLPPAPLGARLRTLTVDVPDGVLQVGDNDVVVATDAVHVRGERSLGVFVDRLAVIADRAPDAGPIAPGVVLGPLDRVEDRIGHLAAGDLVLRWQVEPPAPTPSPDAHLVWARLDASGRPDREIARAPLRGADGTVVLRAPDDLDPAGACGLWVAGNAGAIRITGAEREVPARDDLLWIVIDTLRADVLGCYGDADVATPVIDGLARDGWRFERAFAHAPITGPSHASLFTSLEPTRAGIVNNHQGRLDPSVPTFAEILSAHGYQTRSVVSISPILARFGFARGFDEVDEELGVAFLRDGRSAAAAAGSWLAEPGSRAPRFTFVHLAGPHEPYDAHGTAHLPATLVLDGETLATLETADFGPTTLDLDLGAGPHTLRIDAPGVLQVRRLELLGPSPDLARWATPPPGVIVEGWSGRFTLERDARVRLAVALNDADHEEAELWRRYRLEVEAVDRIVGELLDALERSGRASRTWIVFTADHGEEIGDHGRVGHVDTLFEEVMRIPLIVRPPARSSLPRAVMRDDPAAGIDLMPTLLDLLGIPIPAHAEGRSLRTVGPRDRAVWMQTFAPQAERTLFALRADQHKWIYAPQSQEWMRFDLETDPREREPQAAIDPAIDQSGRAELLRRAQALTSTAPAAAPDPQSEAALRSLGYIEGPHHRD